MKNCTLVLGVDKKHLEQLSIVWPTWQRFRPELAEMPMLVFYDWTQVSPQDILNVIGRRATAVAWPPPQAEYPEGDDKWTNQQRVKMLSGFVYVPAEHVKTRWWLKIDTDVVATARRPWLPDLKDPGKIAICAQKWTFTKPPDQMLRLDAWAAASEPPGLKGTEPLNLVPNEGWGRLAHNRIISWCGFFRTDVTKLAARDAQLTCGRGHLPVPSQDGYLWYWATRKGYDILRVNFKGKGWKHRSTMANVRKAAEEALSAKDSTA